MSQKPDIDQSSEEAPEITSTGESLDTVLSSIREVVTSHAEGGAPGRIAPGRVAPGRIAPGRVAPGRIAPLAAAFDDLRREITQLRENLNEQQSSPALGQKELEDLIARIAQPMLRAWLDAHLPPLAERLIREEIEKLSRER